MIYSHSKVQTRYNVIHTLQIQRLQTSCSQYKNWFDHDVVQAIQSAPLLGKEIRQEKVKTTKVGPSCNTFLKNQEYRSSTKIKVNVVINFNIEFCIPILNCSTEEEFCFLGQLFLSLLMTFLITVKHIENQ